MTDADLYRRGVETLLASWESYARGSLGAELIRLRGVSAAVFPDEPERGVYNNAVLDRDLRAADRAEAVATMEDAYADAGVARFAAWVHESDCLMRADLERRGYTLDTTTRAMGIDLDDLPVPRPEIELALPDWEEYLDTFGFPPGLLSRADHTAFRLLVARLGGENVATAMAFDHGEDCGIYNVGTLEHARRRGLGTALTAVHLHDALDRGCRTASLQSTDMAERVYAAVGFRDLGRILEYVAGETSAAAPHVMPPTAFQLSRTGAS
jgi:ribosomal protein S18 acetylase RimI-like enzyme